MGEDHFRGQILYQNICSCVKGDHEGAKQDQRRERGEVVARDETIFAVSNGLVGRPAQDLELVGALDVLLHDVVDLVAQATS